MNKNIENPILLKDTSFKNRLNWDLVDAKLGLEDSWCENSASQNVLMRRTEVVLLDVVHSIEEVFGTVYQLVFVRTLEALLKNEKKWNEKAF